MTLFLCVAVPSDPHAQIGRPKEPERKLLLPSVKHKQCKGCSQPGRSVKTCISVDLDMLYANLT